MCSVSFVLISSLGLTKASECGPEVSSANSCDIKCSDPEYDCHYSPTIGGGTRKADPDWKTNADGSADCICECSNCDGCTEGDVPTFSCSVTHVPPADPTGCADLAIVSNTVCGTYCSKMFSTTVYSYSTVDGKPQCSCDGLPVCGPSGSPSGPSPSPNDGPGGKGKGKKTPIGPIVGGVVGLWAVLAFGAMCYIRRRKPAQGTLQDPLYSEIADEDGKQAVEFTSSGAAKASLASDGPAGKKEALDVSASDYNEL